MKTITEIEEKDFLLEACGSVRSSGLLEELALLQNGCVHGPSDYQLRLEEVGAGQEALRTNTPPPPLLITQPLFLEDKESQEQNEKNKTAKGSGKTSN